MSRTQVDFHPLAIEDAREARLWYVERSQSAADGFVGELQDAIARIQEAPLRAPAYIKGTRRVLFRRYPHYLVFQLVGDRATVLAVAHGRRKPGYWEDRG